MRFLTAILAACSLPACMVVGAEAPSVAEPSHWDRAAAARYLDSREVWWQRWPHAQKDHGTVCVSCHTQVPYALARPLLRRDLGETKVSDPERAMLDSILKRVELGTEAKTFYTDEEHGPGKTKEARNAEAVNNVLILVAYDSVAYDSVGHDARARQLQPATRKAFEAMWSLQETSGAKAGGWVWQDFHFSPWEAPESEYYGAAMAALAVGMAPDNYASEPAVQEHLKLLRMYLKREAPEQPLMNRVALLWASSKLPGLMEEHERAALVGQIDRIQHDDGGWSLTDFGLNSKGESSWKRRDATPLDTRSDGFATGLALLALETNGMTTSSQAQRGIGWILANQDKAQGLWPAWSVNRKRDPDSDIGRFMSDAATGFAVLALEESRAR